MLQTSDSGYNKHVFFCLSVKIQLFVYDKNRFRRRQLAVAACLLSSLIMWSKTPFSGSQHIYHWVTGNYRLWDVLLKQYNNARRVIEDWSNLSGTKTINSFGAKFQTTFVVCYVFFNKLSVGKKFINKVERPNAKQRRSRWDGSLWAVSSVSTLFAKVYYYRLWQWKSLP